MDIDWTLFWFLALCAGILGVVTIGGWRALLFLVFRLGRAWRGKK